MPFPRCLKCGGQRIAVRVIEEGLVKSEPQCLQCGFTLQPRDPPPIDEDDGRRRKRGGYQLGPRA